MKVLLKISTLLFSGFAMMADLSGQAVVKEFLIEKQYLNFPVDMKQERQMLNFIAGSDTLTYSVMRLGDGNSDYWVFKDVADLKGKKLKITFSKAVKGIGMIYQSDEFAGQDSLYRELNRPQFHFSSRRGWNNDPNGLVYHDGEYHLFYQHNPYETQWENMHWGHAVSSDLLHWRELNSALYPDKLGTMFSGSAVIDKNNTAGWGKNAMVAAYTADKNGKEVQCIAYSTDKGRTFSKYSGNPVVGETRDPKVFWYEPDKKWIMALYKTAGISIFSSKDLKAWKEEDHIIGFYECPELFELPVDNNPNRKCWVMYGGSGTYMLGDFNGKKFTFKHGKYRTTYGKHYAAQTFNNTPDGKRIQIGWGQIEHDKMPFNQMMLFPTELSLQTTHEGIRLFSKPIAAISNLHDKEHDLSKLDPKEANERLKAINSDRLHVVARVESLNGTQIAINYRGNRLVIVDSDEINGIQTPRKAPWKLVFDIEMLIDKTSVEIFYQNGQVAIADALKKPANNNALEMVGDLPNIKIHSFKVYEMKSIWR